MNRKVIIIYTIIAMVVLFTLQAPSIIIALKTESLDNGINSSIISNGISIIGIIVAAWTGLNIVQVIEKKQIYKIKREIDNLKIERKEINNNLLYQNLRSTNDLMNRRLIEMLQIREESMEAEMFYDLNVLENGFVKLYNAHYSNHFSREITNIINYAESLKRKYRRIGWLQYYLAFRTGEIYFYSGYKNRKLKEKIKYMKRAYRSYMKCSSNGIKTNDFLLREEHVAYMLNTVGNCCDSIGYAYYEISRQKDKAGYAGGEQEIDKTKCVFRCLNKKKGEDSLKKRASRYLSYAIKYFEELNGIIQEHPDITREVYIRSEGIVKEHYNKAISEKYTENYILEIYNNALKFSISNNEISRNAVYSWLSYYKKKEEKWNKDTHQQATVYSKMAVDAFPNELVFRKFEMFSLMNNYRQIVSNSDGKIIDSKKRKREKATLNSQINTQIEYLLFTSDYGKSKDMYMKEIIERYNKLIEKDGFISINQDMKDKMNNLYKSGSIPDFV